ncbi:MAG: hypothetical protein A3C84_03115 [Candidatus Ryanbacteria bacterium RIFCSPHIGHO2_02_FULL_48_12]|uniref:Four helix bundle protein n=1 Tax=Candidatus Ryanbacteria bacterium RIFCSPHIGHO2_01_FULL_48_27 TaxID=1802115 RepID=A0A1G2G6V2_9BACT|nr:MAG: hypothetical protein A2756_04420 [Candidatus Ryanbacteria bacterium RIFCSPHIGHO2_01_FULL_48_27]OGZ49642.1 MAG: hypothetical protein A3C84_03115 [Candidatus Ryanbacteria bacterium RIFCSPHIGHO2_02_FULL_48_12]
MIAHTYKDLVVWQKAIDLVLEVYSVTSQFPKEELYGLTSQMRRAAVSIPSNIAEGKLRRSDKEFRQFLLIAFSSGGELETQVILAKRLPKLKELDYSQVDILLLEVMKMLNKMLSLEPKA